MGDSAPPPAYDPNSRHKTFGEMLPGIGPASYGQTTGGGAGFKYDRETLQRLANKWDDLAKEYRDDRQYAYTLIRADGPGLEYASGGNAEMIRTSGDSLYTTLQQREDYCKAMADKYRAALGKYAKAEDDHTSEINKPGGSL